MTLMVAVATMVGRPVLCEEKMGLRVLRDEEGMVS